MHFYKLYLKQFMEESCSFVCEEFRNNALPGDGWSLIYEMKITQPYEMKTYLRHEEKTTKIRSIIKYQIHPVVVANLLKYPRNLLMLYPNILEIYKCDHKELEILMAIYLTRFHGIFKAKQFVMDYDNNEILYFICHVQNNQYNSYIHYCVPYEKGTYFIMEGTVFTSEDVNYIINHTLNIQRQSAQHVFNYLNGDEKERIILGFEQQFNREIHMSMRRFELIHKNKLFEVWVTTNYDELIIRGVATFHRDLNEILGLLEGSLDENLRKGTSKLLLNSPRLRIFHQNYYFDITPYPLDITYAKNIVDGYLFSCSSSTNQGIQFKCSECENKEKKYDVVLAAERTEQCGNELRTIFNYHYFTPILINKSPKERKVFLFNQTNAVIAYRLGLENGNFTYLPFSNKMNQRQFPFHVFHIISSCRKEIENRKTKNCENIIIPPSNVYILDCSNEILQKIFSYLPGNDLMNCWVVCKRFNGVLKHSENIWKSLFELYFDCEHFKTKFDLREEIEKKEEHYYGKVLWHLSLKRHWNERNFLKQQRINIGQSIHFLQIGKSGMVYCGGTTGKWSIFDKDLQPKKSVFYTQNIVGMDVNVKNDRILVAYDNGVIRCYEDTLKGFQYYESVPLQSVEFTTTEKMVGFNKEGVVYCIDLTSGKEELKYKVHVKPITMIKSYNENILMTSSIDHSLIGYDQRTRSNGIFIKNHQEYFTCFDWFSNYIIAGTDSSNIRMYDIRNCCLCVDKTPYFSSVSCLKCYNHKLILGTTSRAVIYMDCNKGNFGTSKLLYNQQSAVTCVDFTDIYLVTGCNGGTIISSQLY